jgi:CTP synthase (UTP-ammonia lyase)
MPASVTIAVVGDRDPTHRTHRALDAALDALPADVTARWVASDAPGLADAVDAHDALWFAPGTPHRDPDAILDALQRARTHGIPSLGTCGGFQMACIELARNVLGLAAAHAELDAGADAPFVAPLGCSLVGRTRTVSPVAGTRLAALMGEAPFDGFHWCSYGLPDRSVAALQRAGAVVAARAPDAGVEAIELPAHPFYVFTLFQPQVATPDPPLLRGLVSAARSARGAARR